LADFQRIYKILYDYLLYSEINDLKFILTGTNEVSEVEESIELIKISRLRSSADELRSK